VTALILHIYGLTWVPPVAVAALIWLAVATRTALVVGPLLRRQSTLGRGNR
jgi:hypothetical protein